MAGEQPVGDIPALEQDQVPPQVVPPQVVPPPVPPRQQRVNPGLQLIRTPPILKLSMDLDTYLRRFHAYTNSIGATPAEMPHLLINSLDDEALQYIERHLVDDITLPELLAVLRREMGISRLNKEDFKAKLRKTLRGRNEEVRSYYSKLWHLAKRAWPDNVEVRNSSLRDVFIGNLQDSGISARLRERPELTNEQILDMAVTLLNCKNASLSRQSEVNAAFGPKSAFDQTLDVESSVRPPSVPSHLIEQKLDQVIGLLADDNDYNDNNDYTDYDNCNDYNEYNDYNDYDDYNDNTDYTDYNDYNYYYNDYNDYND